jgi:hypothetical protein
MIRLIELQMLAPAFDAINSVEDVWSYVEHRFLRSLQIDAVYSDSDLNGDQSTTGILGPVFFTQKRIEPISCTDVLSGEQELCFSDDISTESFGGPNSNLFKWSVFNSRGKHH